MASSDFVDDFANLRLNDKKDINILILGETGVGKSTFINSIANYLTHKSLKRALKNDFTVLIPSQITITDKTRQPISITVGKFDDQKNEFNETGASATQDVKTYVFPIGEQGQTKLRLIDTPGMADCRGIQQDDQNCENILNYLQQLKELHGICFLLKPGQARITVAFEYCIKQIFARLDKSASQNLIFIFTNTRGTQYDAGETLPCLIKVISEIRKRPPHVEIPLKDNIFCLDNEGFRYLAGAKHGVDFDEDFKDDCKKSWKKSARECWRLISYLVGDANRRPLRPHQLSNTVSINEARKLIIQLTQPLAEITQLINDNLYALDRHRYQLRMQNQSLDELKKKLYMPVVNLEITKLTQPATVCAGKQCAEVYKVGELNKWHYKQRCHDPCYLTNVAAEMIGDPGLRRCAAMNGSETCGKCRCNFSIHMHIYYMSKTVNDKIIDNVIQTNITTKQNAVVEAEKLIQEIDQKRTELEDEREAIITATAQFAHFLQNNAITPFNDSYKSYIQHLIIRERSLGSAADAFSIHNLEKLLQQHEEAKRAFDHSLNQTVGTADSIDTKNVLDTIKKLYKLKHTGRKIQEMLDKQKVCRRKEFERTEYVHASLAKPPVAAADVDKNQKKDKIESDSKQKQIPSKTNFSPPPPPPYTRFPASQNRGQFRNRQHHHQDNRNVNRNQNFKQHHHASAPNVGVRVEVTQTPHPGFGGNFGQQPSYHPQQQQQQASGFYPQMPQQHYPLTPPPYQQNYIPPLQQNYQSPYQQFPNNNNNYQNPYPQQNYGQQFTPQQQQHQQQQWRSRRGGGRPKQGGFRARNKSGARYSKKKPNQTSEDNYDSSSSSSD